MLKFITTKTGHPSRLTARGVGAGGTAAFALVVVNTGVGVFQVSVLLLGSAALFKLLPLVAGEGTRALAPACVRVGRPRSLSSRMRQSVVVFSEQPPLRLVC